MSSPLVLTPAESLVLLDTAGSTGREALKITLMSLMARGFVAIEQRAKKGLFGTKKTAALRRARELPPGTPAHEGIVADMVRWTDQPHARWHLIAAEDKHFARVTVLETLNLAIEHGLARCGLTVPPSKGEEYRDRS